MVEARDVAVLSLLADGGNQGRRAADSSAPADDRHALHAQELFAHLPAMERFEEPVRPGTIHTPRHSTRHRGEDGHGQNHFGKGDHSRGSGGATQEADDGSAGESRTSRKDRHRDQEKRRRDGLNNAFNDLQMLLPDSQNTKKEKIVILQEAIVHVKALQDELSTVVRNNALMAGHLDQMKLAQGNMYMQNVNMATNMNSMKDELEALRKENQRLRAHLDDGDAGASMAAGVVMGPGTYNMRHDMRSIYERDLARHGDIRIGEARAAEIRHEDSDDGYGRGVAAVRPPPPQQRKRTSSDAGMEQDGDEQMDRIDGMHGVLRRGTKRMRIPNILAAEV